jgi:hypothetical protein
MILVVQQDDRFFTIFDAQGAARQPIAGRQGEA